MSQYDRESIEAIIARANRQRSDAMGEILGHSLRGVTDAIGKVCGGIAARLGRKKTVTLRLVGA